MKKVIMVLMLAGICLSGVAYGGEYPFIYKGMRPMGMGGAFTAVSNDANALFYNPAGLADIQETRASILPLELEISDNAFDIYDDAKDVDFDDDQETGAYLRDNIGKRSHLGLNIFPNLSKPGFAFGLISASNINLEVKDRQYPKIAADIVSDVGAGVGYARPMLEKRLLLGSNFKYVYRNNLVEEYTVLDITGDDFEDTIEDDLRDGHGVLVDVGAIYKLDGDGLPGAQVGISLNNVISKNFGNAREFHDHVDIGFAITRPVWVTTATFAVDYYDLFSQVGKDNDLAKRLRLGAEFSFPRVLSVRGGIYQGYLTAGMTLDAKFVRLDLLTYAEEIGAYAGQRSDRRYAMRMTFGF